MYPNLKFELLDVMWGLSSVVLYYVNQKGSRTGKVFRTDDEGQIRQLIARFANSFDLKAWDALRECLAESVELRRRALDSLKTHHLAGYPEITVEGARGR